VSPERAAAVARVLRSRLQWRLHTGTIRIGDRIPGARELAEEFSVDVRTALRACRVLECEGLIETRLRSGMYVAMQQSPPPSLSATQTTVVDLLCEASARGISPGDLGQLLTSHFYQRRCCIACIEETADHAVAISDVIARDYAVDTVSASVADVMSSGADRVLSNVVAAVTTSFLATTVKRVAESRRLPVFVATMRPALGIDLMRSLSSRPIYLIGVDRGWADRAEAGLEGADVSGNLRLVVVGEDDLDQIPADAEVFLTPAAAPLVTNHSVARRARRLEYGLSPSEERGLIATLVAEQASYDPAVPGGNGGQQR
jgi:DNA-binding transcriptional regulator YhcF (GntR family)